MASPHRSAELHSHGWDGATLIKRTAKGDEYAFATLYDITCGLIYGLLLRILGNSETAEQILVGVYQEAWEQAATYDERENPMTWLITIAHSRAIAQLREKKHYQPQQESLEKVNCSLKTDPKTDEKISERQRFVSATFAALSPEQQQMIDLAYFSGLRPNEIAERLGLPLQSVQTVMRAVMITLRDGLGAGQIHLA